MTAWDPDRYLVFADERGRPFADLIARVPTSPGSIVDLGCGPGQLTPRLRERWPDATILGVDSSASMIERAVRDNTDPQADYRLSDLRAWQPEQPVDLIVSNATFQWVPDQLDIIPALREYVAPGGVLAFQVPDNYEAPSHSLLHRLADEQPYRDTLAGVTRRRRIGAGTYLRLLAGPGWRLDAWTTTYCHVLQGPDAVFRWVSGTGARPFLQALGDDLRPRFVEDYTAALRQAYPEESFGTLLEFERVFVVACRVPVREPA